MRERSVDIFAKKVVSLRHKAEFESLVERNPDMEEAIITKADKTYNLMLERFGPEQTASAVARMSMTRKTK